MTYRIHRELYTQLTTILMGQILVFYNFPCVSVYHTSATNSRMDEQGTHFTSVVVHES